MELVKDEMYGKELGGYILLERIKDNSGKKKYRVKDKNTGEITDMMELRALIRKENGLNFSEVKRNPEMIVGKTIGKLFIISYEGINERYIPIYKTKCIKCDFEMISDLRVIMESYPDSLCGHIGTWSSEKLREIYDDMIRRCYDPSRQNYRSYGAKGIDVCPEWRRSPWRFDRWAIENGYRDGLSIDRINPNRGYYPDNCQWVTLDYNRKWNSYSQYIVINGVKDTQAGWCKRLGLYDTAIHYYMKTHSYEETALYISQLQHPDKTVICVEVDSELFESRNKKESMKYDK